MNDPAVGSCWRLDDGRIVQVIGIYREFGGRQPIALRVEAFTGGRHRVIHMSQDGFWKRAKEQL